MIQFPESWFEFHGGRLLIVLAAGSTMILVVTALASQCLTRISAATRFTIWQIAILSLGLLPLGWLCLPEIPLGLLAKKSTPPIEVGKYDASDLPVHRPESSFATIASSENPSAYQSGQSTSPLKPPSHFEPVTTRTNQNFTAAETRSSFKRMSASQLTILFWLGVAAIFLARVLINHLRTALAIRLVTIAKPAIKGERTELPPHVTLYYSDQLKIPITVGILRKRIILPMEAEHWCADQFRMVVKHELAHIERNDVFWQLILSVFKSIYWFQPLLWWAAQESTLAREQACDDRVIAGGEDQADYATTLVQLAASISGRSIFPSGAISMSQKPIERRLRTILSSDTPRSTTNRWLACFAASVALLIATSVSSLRPFQPIPVAAQVVQEPDSSPPQTSSPQEAAVEAKHLRQERPDSYQLNSNDVLGIYIEGVLGEAGSLPPVRHDAGNAPAVGFPVPIRTDGTIVLPLVDPIVVKDLTIQQAETLVKRAYRGGANSIIAAESRITVTLMQARTYRVFVVRQDNIKQKRYVLNLSAYRNDVLNALLKTGGLPGMSASPEVSVLHTDSTQANLIRDFQIAEFYKTHSPQEFPTDAIPTFKKAVGTLQIPLRVKLKDEIDFKTNDIILQDGDIVYVNARPTKSSRVGLSLPHSITPNVPPLKDSTAQQEFDALRVEHDKFSQAYRESADQATDEVELNRVCDDMDPREIMTPKYLIFEEAHRGASQGLDALVRISEMARSVGDPNSAVAKGRVEAIDRIIAHYLDHEGLESVADTLGGGPSVPRADEFLQALVEKSPYAKTRAEALIRQIKTDKLFLSVETQIPSLRKQLAEFPSGSQYRERRDELERAIVKLEGTDFQQLRRDANEKLDRLADSYRNLKVDSYDSGGEASQRLSHAINKVVIGKPAPELAATDINGKPFRLSEHRGKIVVLMFTLAPYNDDYSEMYAPMRQLVARYRQAPVRVVGIMGNNDEEKLRAAFDRGEMNWTVIPAPIFNGPIHKDWGIESYPSVYIIDDQGTLHPMLGMSYYGAGGFDTKDVVDKLDELLRAKYRNDESTIDTD